MIERRHAPVLAGLAKSISEGGGKSPEELELAVRQIVSRAISSDKLLGKVKHSVSTSHPGPLRKSVFPRHPSPGLRPPSPAPASEGHRSRRRGCRKSNPNGIESSSPRLR